MKKINMLAKHVLAGSTRWKWAEPMTVIGAMQAGRQLLTVLRVRTVRVGITGTQRLLLANA